MTITIADRVKEATTTTGTGTYTLAGAASGFRTFTSKVTIGQQCYYCCALGADWEVGEGTLVTSSTLSRTTILASSNAGAAVSWGAGSKDIFITVPAASLLGTIGIGGLVPLAATEGSLVTKQGADYLRTGVVALKTDFPLAPGFSELVNPITWTQRTLPVASGVEQGMAWNGTVFCLVTGTITAATSADGISWTQRTLPVSATWKSIAWNGSVFCALVSFSTTAATSADGITWTQRTLPVYLGWKSIAWNGTVFCAVAQNSTITVTSSDGITWTQRAGNPGFYVKCIGGGGSIFWVLDSNTGTVIATSTDGITWTERTLPFANWQDIEWNGSIFCAIAYNSTIAATSSDGITWTQRTLPVSGTWVSIACVGAVFCAVADTGATATSSDGISWTQGTLTSAYWCLIGGSDSIFCAVVYNSTTAATAAVLNNYAGEPKAKFADEPTNQFPYYMRVS